MRKKRVISKDLGGKKNGVNVAGGIHAVISASVNEKGSSRTSIKSRHRIVQRNGETVVDEHEFEEGSD